MHMPKLLVSFRKMILEDYRKLCTDDKHCKRNCLPDLFHVYQLSQASNKIHGKPVRQHYHSPPHV